MTTTTSNISKDSRDKRQNNNSRTTHNVKISRSIKQVKNSVLPARPHIKLVEQENLTINQEKVEYGPTWGSVKCYFSLFLIENGNFGVPYDYVMSVCVLFFEFGWDFLHLFLLLSDRQIYFSSYSLFFFFNVVSVIFVRYNISFGLSLSLNLLPHHFTHLSYTSSFALFVSKFINTLNFSFCTQSFKEQPWMCSNTTLVFVLGLLVSERNCMEFSCRHRKTR